MLQTRAGRCPNCKEETPAGAEVCPSCGARLDWENQPPAPVEERQGTGVAAFLRLFAVFLCACIATFLAVTWRTKTPAPDASPGPDAGHAVSVRDAETFRDQIRAAVGNTDALEAAYVLGVAMPNGKDVLEITVKRAWKALDDPTRLAYAARFDERWRAIRAPHHADLVILDEDGNRIGGRVGNGAVWVAQNGEGASAPPSPQPEAANTATINAPTERADEPPATKTNQTSTPDTSGASNTVADPAPTTQAPDNAPSASATPPPRDPDDLSDIETQ